MSSIDDFIKAVENNDFVEGHEVLEEDWKRLKKDLATIDESKILKGLINGSTAIALKLRGKDGGADRVWDTFEKYKPLIETTPCQNSEKYKIAKELLEKKKDLYM
jgi:hypothetical protein